MSCKGHAARIGYDDAHTILTTRIDGLPAITTIGHDQGGAAVPGLFQSG